MTHFFKLSLVITGFLLISCNSTAQQKDDYSQKIDSLIQVKNPRPFNGVILK